MRQVRYAVAMSLDGYIAGPQGEADWIVMDPDIDFRALTARFDTILMGRRTWEQAQSSGGGGMPGMAVWVCSHTLEPGAVHDATLSRDAAATIRDLQARPGRDLWLFGGGALFGSLLDAGLVDAVEVAIIPVLLGGGIPFLPGRASRARLELRSHRVYPRTGTVWLEYGVRRPAS